MTVFVKNFRYGRRILFLSTQWKFLRQTLERMYRTISKYVRLSISKEYNSRVCSKDDNVKTAAYLRKCLFKAIKMFSYSLFDITTNQIFPPMDVIFSGRSPNFNFMYNQTSSQAGIPFGPIRLPCRELLTPEVGWFARFWYFEWKNDCVSMI